MINRRSQRFFEAVKMAAEKAMDKGRPYFLRDTDQGWDVDYKLPKNGSYLRFSATGDVTIVAPGEDIDLDGVTGAEDE